MATEQVLPGKVHLHGACDVSTTCQRVLLNHGPEHAAEHVSKDLLARPPRDVVDKLKQELDRFQERDQK